MADALRERLERARLYLVCDARPDAFLDAVLDAGVDVLQLREKRMEARELLAHAARFRAACDRHGALFVVNDRADVALSAGADGLHVGQGDLPPENARKMLGPEPLIGRSTHARAEMRVADDEPVDYVCCGPVHPTPTKPGRAATGLGLLADATRECRKPWFAIGGIDVTTLPDVVAAGAARIVVVRAVTEADDPAAAVRALRRGLEA